MKALNRAAAELKRRGWHTRTALVHGEPLRDLLRTVAPPARNCSSSGRGAAAAFVTCSWAASLKVLLTRARSPSSSRADRGGRDGTGTLMLVKNHL